MTLLLAALTAGAQNGPSGGGGNANSSIYAARCTPSASASAPEIPFRQFLVGEWLFPAGNPTNDSSGVGNHAIDPGGANSPVSTNFGGIQCLFLGGVDDYYSLGDSRGRYYVPKNDANHLDPVTQSLVVAYWVFQTANQGNYAHWIGNDANQEPDYGGRWERSTAWGDPTVMRDNWGDQQVWGGATIPNNTWILMTGICLHDNSGSFGTGRTFQYTNFTSVYINNGGLSRVMGTTNVRLSVGARPFANDYGAVTYIDDVRIWRITYPQTWTNDAFVNEIYQYGHQ